MTRQKAAPPQTRRIAPNAARPRLLDPPVATPIPDGSGGPAPPRVQTGGMWQRKEEQLPPQKKQPWLSHPAPSCTLQPTTGKTSPHSHHPQTQCRPEATRRRAGSVHVSTAAGRVGAGRGFSFHYQSGNIYPKIWPNMYKQKCIKAIYRCIYHVTICLFITLFHLLFPLVFPLHDYFGYLCSSSSSSSLSSHVNSRVAARGPASGSCRRVGDPVSHGVLLVSLLEAAAEQMSRRLYI